MNTYLAPPQSLPFELGEPAAFGGLALVPLVPTAEPRLDYIGLDEAVANGLAVTEVDEAPPRFESCTQQHRRICGSPST